MMIFKTVFVLILFFTCEVLAEKLNLEYDDKCRVLAMRGGGSRGAYEIGSLKAMAQMLDPIDIAYDVIEGVSIGGVNALFFSTYERGDEKAAIDELEQMWLALPIRDLWRWWSFGLIEALWRQSFLDNTKMKEKMHDQFKNVTIHRNLTVQAVDLNTGKIVVFDETAPLEDLIEAVISSASIPAVFLPVQMGQYNLVDGGVFTNMKFTDAIQKCQEKGFTDDKIIVDLLMCSDEYQQIQEWQILDAKYMSAFSFYNRKESFQDFYHIFEDISREIRGYPEVNFRHLFLPQKPIILDSWLPIFDGVEAAKSMVSQGEEETRRNLKMYLCEQRNKCDEEDLVDESDHYNQDQNINLEDSAQKDVFGEDGMPIVRASRGKKSPYHSIFGFHTIREFISMQNEGVI